MSDLPFPTRAEAISADWLSSVLGTRVAGRRITRIGEDEGFTGGALYRVALEMPDRPPASLVAKLAPDRADLRADFAPANRREVTFYSAFATGADLPVPRCHFGAFDASSGASLLLLEDLGRCRPASFIAGCPPADADRAVVALAGIHAHFWNDDRVRELGAGSLLREFDFGAEWARYQHSLRGLFPDITLPGWFVAFGDEVAAAVDRLFARLFDTGPITCIHRDPQVDNILFADSGGGAVLLDWQFAGHGKGAYDLAYFLISSLSPQDRRQHEAALIGRYHASLIARGVADYGRTECEADYRAAVVGKLFVTVVATTRLDNSSPHKRAWRRADLERLLAFCDDQRARGGLMALARPE